MTDLYQNGLENGNLFSEGKNLENQHVLGSTSENILPNQISELNSISQQFKIWRQQFKDARKTLADDTHELDILQREYNLKQQQYYSDPNVAMREQFTSKDLTDTKKSIDNKTAAVEKDKQAISDLEDSLRQSGGDAGWSREQ